MERNKKGEFAKGHKSDNFKGVTWKKCPNCNKEFYVTSKNKRNKFCSQSCSAKYRIKVLRKKGLLLKGEYGKCKTCEKKIYFEPREIGKNKFCSKKCFYEYRKGWINEKMRESLDRGRHNQKGMPKFTEEMKKKQSIRKKKDWSDLEKRREYMKSRTPEKLKRFREGHKKYLDENKGNLPIKNIKNNRVIDNILKNEN